ncbi:Ribonuclease G [Nocardioides dokdonensis FR1436]|uniref:Ribonuclease E n=1 Tax=Nocardioides dokdonensis FR1436 TaxID=1300347 RepID=A0A1A9GKM3_9ACTN|nr:Rne/Rng family ribonuclease [Nocardioides dokdonensis]ANH38824.1 Ribonuclease G [Nocardioides dokdonensis FR1436]
MPDENQVGQEPTTSEVPTAESGAAAQETAAPKVTTTTRTRKSTAKAPAKKSATKKSTAKAATPTDEPGEAQLDLGEVEAAPAKKAAAKKAPAKKAAAKKAPAKKAAAKPAEDQGVDAAAAEAPTSTRTTTTTRAARKSPAKKTAAAAEETPVPATVAPEARTEPTTEPTTEPVVEAGAGVAPLFQAPAVTTTTRKRTAKKVAPAKVAEPVVPAEDEDEADEAAPAVQESSTPARTTTTTTTRRTRGTAAAKAAAATQSGEQADEQAAEKAPEKAAEKPAAKTRNDDRNRDSSVDQDDDSDDDDENDDDETGGQGSGTGRRRRRRGGRRRRKSGDGGDGGQQDSDDSSGSTDTADASESGTPNGGGNSGGNGGGNGGGGRQGGGRDGNRGGSSAAKEKAENDNGPGNGPGDDEQDGDENGGSTSSRRRRRRRRSGEDGGDGGDDPSNTVTRVRSSRTGEDQITALSGSTRLEAKKQRRREGREAGRRRAPIASEAEFLARREAVDRVMVIRQREDLTQIGVLEDKVLVEHYVARESQTSLIGNVYLGRVQNVLPSMEAAFIDIGKGRNAVLYAGEVNWAALGHKEGQPRKMESVLSSGQSVLVQVTKDPMGHKGARLTSQVSLAGRFLVYVPDGTSSGISRKLPDTERARLKALLKEIVPDSAGVIVRTAAEGASEEELTRDVERLKARWDDIEKKAKGNGPQLLYGEPDLTLKVVRDLFTEDFAKLVIDGDEAWETVSDYVSHVAPDLQERLERFEPATEGKQAGKDAFAAHRIDEQIAKGLDRKVFLPSGGSLVIDRTEAMTVVDVNTGKFTGSGGNLEETVTKNNLEAAEEVVRQLRLRDIGGIIVVDFIDMVLESNRDLVLRRMVECLGRDRTRHQVAEVTSLGLIQMTRKRIGTGLLEAFSEPCEHCSGRGILTLDHPVEPKHDDDGRRGGGGGGNSSGGGNSGSSSRRSRGGKGGGNDSDAGNDGGRGGRGGGKGGSSDDTSATKAPSPKDVAAMARHENAEQDAASAPAEQQKAAEQDQPTGQDQPAEPEQPQKSTRTRSRRAPQNEKAQNEKAQTEKVQADEVQPVAEPETVPVPDEAHKGADSQPTGSSGSAEPAQQPAAPAEQDSGQDAAGAPGTRVVTRTRRRAATRPAGQPTTAGEPVVMTAPDVVPAPEAAAAPATTAPKVVTRTRKR